MRYAVRCDLLAKHLEKYSFRVGSGIAHITCWYFSDGCLQHGIVLCTAGVTETSVPQFLNVRF
jgi:hypothetical protein